MKYFEHGKKLLAWCSQDKLEMEKGSKNIFPTFLGFYVKIRLCSLLVELGLGCEVFFCVEIP